MREVRKIDHRHDKHPNEIDEVPVQAHGLDVAWRQPAAPILGANDQHGNDADDHVQQVKSGNAEEGLAKKT